MKKVLVITYYWPPSGGAGVQRWLKFAKYLREFGWDPIIYTPENPEVPAEDNSLISDVPDDLTILKTRIWEPYSSYKKFVGRKSSDKIKSGFLSEKKGPSITEKVSVWIRGNLFIPDARKFWIKPSVQFLKNYLIQHPVDAIVSTGPPHSMHLIAMQLAQHLKLPWLADFRDPWTNIDFYQELKLSKTSDRKHHQLEEKVLRMADRVVVATPGMKRDFESILSRSYDVITNGFDEPMSKQVEHMDELFSIAHIGSMVPARNPEILWQALKELKKENKSFAEKLEIKLIGQIDYSVRESIEVFGLVDHLKTIDYLPHDKVILTQQQSQLLLLLINDSPNANLVLTGKVFEYINANRPIVCIGPTHGDAAALISETNTGITLDYSDLKGLKMAILSFFIRYQEGDLKPKSRDIEKYSRKNLTGDLASILNAL